MNRPTAQAAVRGCTRWRKSTASQAESDCVEITTELPGWIGIRDSKLGTDSPILMFPVGGWRAMRATQGSAR